MNHGRGHAVLRSPTDEAFLLTAAGLLWLHDAAGLGDHAGHAGLDFVDHVGIGAAAFPLLALVAVLGRRLPPVAGAAFTGLASALALAAVTAAGTALLAPGGATATTVLAAFVALAPLHLLLAALVRARAQRAAAPPTLALPPPRSAYPTRPVRRRGLRPAAAVAVVGALATVVTLLPPPPPAAAQDNGPCPAGARSVTYEVVAFQTVIPVNGWGDKVLDGLVYALRSQQDAIRANPNLTQPLVIRANVGDCITVEFENQVAGRKVGLHADPILRFDPKTSDGSHVGANPDSTGETGQRRSYTWYADRAGQGARRSTPSSRRWRP